MFQVLFFFGFREKGLGLGDLSLGFGVRAGGVGLVLELKAFYRHRDTKILEGMQEVCPKTLIRHKISKYKIVRNHKLRTLNP